MVDKIDPDTADLEELRAMPYLMDAVHLSCARKGRDQRGWAWECAINALMRMVPL